MDAQIRIKRSKLSCPSVEPSSSNLETLSLLERMPKELLTQIFEYVPEAVFELRKVGLT